MDIDFDGPRMLNFRKFQASQDTVSVQATDGEALNGMTLLSVDGSENLCVPNATVMSLQKQGYNLKYQTGKELLTSAKKLVNLGDTTTGMDARQINILSNGLGITTEVVRKNEGKFSSQIEWKGKPCAPRVILYLERNPRTALWHADVMIPNIEKVESDIKKGIFVMDAITRC